MFKRNDCKSIRHFENTNQIFKFPLVIWSESKQFLQIKSIWCDFAQNILKCFLSCSLSYQLTTKCLAYTRTFREQQAKYDDDSIQVIDEARLGVPGNKETCKIYQWNKVTW